MTTTVRNKQKKFTEEFIDKCVSLYKEGKSLSDISQECGISQTHLHRKIKNKVKMRKNCDYSLSDKQKYYRKRNYFLDIDFFEKIDTFEKAYILGYFYADGYVNINDSYAELCLHQQDTSILNEIHKVIGGKLRPYRQNMARLSFYSKKICEDLTKYGCHQNKTFTLLFPNIEPVLYSSFIRGYFDGDGSFYKSGKYGGVVSFAGNLNFLEKLSDVLSESLNIQLRRIEPHGKIGYLRYSKRSDLQKIHNYIYCNKSVFYLDRKFSKYVDVLNNPSKEFLVDTSKIVDLYFNGLSVAKIAEQLSMSREAIYKRLVRSGQTSFKRKKII